MKDCWVYKVCSLPDQVTMMSQESSSCQSDEIGIAGNPELSTSGDLAERKDFGEWLQFVSQCLKGHPNMTSARRKKEEMFEEKEEKEESEEERCLRVVKSVLDEETVLEMATDFLQMTRGADVPDSAFLSFKSCNFDREKGELFQAHSI